MMRTEEQKNSARARGTTGSKALGARFTVAVGGHSRKIGKTSVIAALIRQTAHCDWTTLKISANRQANGPLDSFQLYEEFAPGSQCDTARYLQAGARRALWLKASDTQLQHGLPAALNMVSPAANLLVESNRLLDFARPNLFLVLLDFAVEDFKESTRHHFHQADAFVLIDRPEVLAPPWEGLPLELLTSRPVFRVSPANCYASADLALYVESSLRGFDRRAPPAEQPVP